jgi:hypothetical protein
VLFPWQCAPSLTTCRPFAKQAINMSTQEGAITPLHPDPTNSIVRPVTAAHAQLTSAPAVASTLSRPRVMDQSHAPLPTKPSVGAFQT